MNKLSKKKSKLNSPKKLDKEQILDNLSAGNALEILKILAKEDTKISKRIEELALEYLTDVDADAIADDVFTDLNFLEVEDVLDNSGETRDGYVEPYEIASEMFEETLEPYTDDLIKYQKFSMNEEAKKPCMGILKGIYKFEHEATTEFKDWAEDDPQNNFIRIFEDWKEKNKDPKKEEEMNGFVKKNFPEWYENILRKK